MSSILDALERAEKERNQIDKKPFIDTGTVTPGLLHRRSLWVFAGVLVLINLLVWFWVARGPEQASEQPVSDTTQPKQQSMATADTVVSILEQPKGGKERKSDPPLVVEALVPKKVATIKPADTDAPMPPPAQQVAASQPSIEPVKARTAPVVKTPAPIPAQPVDEPVPTVVASLRDNQAEVSNSQPPAVQVEQTVQPVVEPDETEQIPLLWELPANVQEKLSDLKINILVYNEDAAQRFVIINMRKYREGDRLVPSGMQLERITRKGVVIDYGDGLVRL